MSISPTLVGQSSDEEDLSDLARNQELLAKPQPKLNVIEYRETEEGKKVAGWAKTKFHKCKTLRAREEQQWNINYAFFSGNQWAKLTQPGMEYLSGGGLINPVTPKGKERLIINRIKSVCRTEMSKFLTKRPGASVVPATAEDADRGAAEAAEQIWESIQTRRKLSVQFGSSIFWMVITGNGFIKTYWDDDLLDTDTGVDGDVCFGSVDPYKLFFPDLNVEQIQDQKFMFHAYSRPTEELKLQYAAELEGMTLSSSCKASDTILHAAFAAPRSTDQTELDSNMVIELWVKPGICPDLIQGGRIVLIEDIMVAADIEGIPYAHGEFPFAHFGHIPTGRFYRSSIIEELLGLQKSYNEIRSDIKDAAKKMGKPQLLAPKGSISAAKITNEAGLVIEYRVGMPAPQPLPLQQIPQYVLDQIQLILTDIEDISGQHQVTKGTVPPGVTAAAAISYLQEADDSYLFTSYSAVEEAFESIARQTLQLVVQYWDEPRLVKIAGDNEAFDVKMLAGSNIKNGLDIRVEKGSALPQSKAAKQAFVMDLMNAGFVPVEDGLAMLEIGGSSQIMERMQIDRRQAQRENVQFRWLTPESFAEYDAMWQRKVMEAEMGVGGESIMDEATQEPVMQPPIIPVNSWDNHEVHIEEHNNFRKGQSYATLSEEAQIALEKHVQMHKNMMMGDALEQMLQGIPSDGSVPGVNGAVEGEEMDVPPSEMDLAGTPADNLSTAEAGLGEV